MTIDERLMSLGFILPSPPKPVAAYIPAVLIDNWVYTSGQLPFENGVLKFQGKLGRDVTINDGYSAAQICLINALSAIKAVSGNLDKIERIVKVVGFVNSAADFTQQPAIINGASELLKQLFGEKGEHARSAVGVAELPLNASVEIEMIVKLSH
jgi:enamine deaminase RidA (YjgF/YER057c/UK114 family)